MISGWGTAADASGRARDRSRHTRAGNLRGMSEQRVAIDIDGHVAEVRLTRPDKHNALDAAMFQGIVGAAERLRSEPGVRAVVLHGEGPSFCSGLDIAGFMADPSATTDYLVRQQRRLSRTSSSASPTTGRSFRCR